MTYTDTLAVLAASTETTVVALHQSWREDLITDAEFVALAAAALLRGHARGVALADVALAAALSLRRRTVVAPIGLDLPTGASGAARAAVETTLASQPYQLDAVAAVAVLGRSHALAAAQDAYAAGMRAHGVQRWTRVLNAGACELCQDLAGDVLPASADMYHHKGCGCTQQPVN